VELVYGKQTEPNQASMRRTLALLDKEGLVHRERYIEPDRNFGGTTGVWGLSDKGVVELHRLGQIDLFTRAKSFDEHSVRTLDHELEISYFHMALKKLPHQLYWQQAELKRSVHPDAYFALTDPALPEGKNTFHYFLEIEKGKKTFDDLLKKLGRYYDLYNTDKCEKEWGFRQFRVIVIQKNDTRRANLLAELAKKYNHRMFWLGTEADRLSFQTPKDLAKANFTFTSQ
jgi:DNA-binding PadR family transcriptional regulator